MSLQNWERKGWVEKHKTSPQEIEELFQIGDRDLKDCQAEHLSEDWQLNIAYNAALQSAKAALAAGGYRTAREAQHFRIIQILYPHPRPNWLHSDRSLHQGPKARGDGD